MIARMSHLSPATSARAAWIATAALLVGIVAVALAVWGLVRSPESGESNLAAASGDPKTVVCDAFNTVRTAVSLQTNADLGPDKVAQQAVAANARLATLGGGQFLLSRLNPSVPKDLADAVRSFATDLEYIGMSQLAGVGYKDPAQTARQKTAQETAAKIAALCA
jgi:hypothetical protein